MISRKSSASKDSGSANGKKTEVLSQAMMSKKSSSIYSRIVERKTATVYKSTSSSISDKFMGLFSGESKEDRAIRSHLKAYKYKLQNELQLVIKANAKHRNRFLEQANEFTLQEKQLRNWGLFRIIPLFRLQAWARLSRSALLEEITGGLVETIQTRLEKTSIYTKLFEESSNRASKYSIQAAQEFCQDPEVLMFSDMSLITMSSRLLRLDYVCSVTIRNFKLLEPELAVSDDARREMALIDILGRFLLVPSLNDLKNIETDLTWEDFCDWYAARQVMLQGLEQEFCALIEDQRHQIGRLFARWVQSLLLSIAQPTATTTTTTTDASVGAGAARHSVNYRNSNNTESAAAVAAAAVVPDAARSRINSHRSRTATMDAVLEHPEGIEPPVFSHRKSVDGAPDFLRKKDGWDDGVTTSGFTAGPSPDFMMSPQTSNNINDSSTSASISMSSSSKNTHNSTITNKDDSFSESISDRNRTAAVCRQDSSAVQRHTSTATGIGSTVGAAKEGITPSSTATETVAGVGSVPQQQQQQAVVLKMTPVSIKAFIKYFANDIVGVHFHLPKKLAEANVALTGMLFYK